MKNLNLNRNHLTKEEIKIKTITDSIEGKTFAELTDTDKKFLALLLRSKKNNKFTQKQKELLSNWYLLINPSQVLKLNELTLDKTNRISLISLEDERLVIPLSILTDCRKGETFSYLRDFLFNLTFIKVEMKDIKLYNEKYLDI
jgi:hypothetical protein